MEVPLYASAIRRKQRTFLRVDIFKDVVDERHDLRLGKLTTEINSE